MARGALADIQMSFLVLLGSSNEPQTVAVTQVEWRLAMWERGKLRGLRADEVSLCVIDPYKTESRSLAEHVIATAAASPALMLFPAKGTPFLPGDLCFSSQWDFSCYLWLEAWKSWLIIYSTLFLTHSLAQLFFHLLHFCAPFTDLLRDLCASRTIWKAWGHLGAV